MVRYDESAGIRGLKQIARSLVCRDIEKEQADIIFERHTQHFLERCFPDWMK